MLAYDRMSESCLVLAGIIKSVMFTAGDVPTDVFAGMRFCFVSSVKLAKLVTRLGKTLRFIVDPCFNILGIIIFVIHFL